MKKIELSSFADLFVNLGLIIAVISLLNINVSAAYRPVYDFTGDSRTDFTILTIPATAGNPLVWKFLRNPGLPGPGNAFIRTMNFGTFSDQIVAADFYGDSKTELAIRRPSENLYYETLFPETSVAPVVYESWGMAGDSILGREGDYNGDGKDDETVIRIVSNQLQWWIKGSDGNNRVTIFGGLAMGFSTFAFQGADFTGDGRDELIVCLVTVANGAATWYVGDSITGTPLLQVQWGNFNTDYFINPDDYTGDGLADIPVWRAGGTGADARYWFIRDTATGALLPPVLFGLGSFTTGDLPLRGNYDGDNKADIAVWRPSTQEWFWINSSDGSLGIQQWGAASNEIPLPNFFTF